MISTRNIQLLRIIIITVFLGFLLSCSGGINSSASGTPQPYVPPVTTQSVMIGAISTIPITSGGGQSSTAVVVTNGLHNAIEYISYSLGNTTIKPNAGFKPVNVPTECATIASGDTCNVTINTSSSDGSFVLTMNFKDVKTGQTYSASQVISYSSSVPITNGFQVSNTNLNIYKPADSPTTVAIPFLLTENYLTIPTVTSSIPQVFMVQNVQCSNQNTSGILPSGTLCTAFVQIANLGTSPVVQDNISISGTSSIIKRQLM